MHLEDTGDDTDLQRRGVGRGTDDSDNDEDAKSTAKTQSPTAQKATVEIITWSDELDLAVKISNPNTKFETTTYSKPIHVPDKYNPLSPMQAYFWKGNEKRIREGMGGLCRWINTSEIVWRTCKSVVINRTQHVS